MFGAIQKYSRPKLGLKGKKKNRPLAVRKVGLACSGGGIRTRDLRVMLTLYDFHRRSNWTVCGLDFLFTLGRTVRGLPLSLYTFPKRAWLGITTQQASPNLTRIHVPVSFRTQPTNTIAV